MAYARNTDVAVEKSLGEIAALARKAGATRIGQIEDIGSFAVQFFLRDRMVRFRVRLPGASDVGQKRGNRPATEAEIKESVDGWARQRARALLLVIKAKLESVESEVETFEEAFLANVVMADGATVYERISEPLRLEYETGKPMPMLLEGPRP